jgi:adenosine deaminase
METLHQVLPYKEWIVGVGLDSSEVGHPPEAFEEAGRLGFRRVAPAGEEGPPEYIRQALGGLGAARIDHGVRCVEDPGLARRLGEEQVPLTVCQLFNVRLRGFPALEEHPVKRMLREGLCVTVNSDSSSARARAHTSPCWTWSIRLRPIAPAVRSPSRSRASPRGC